MKPFFLFVLFVLCGVPMFVYAQTEFLTKEEQIWLSKRNNTIVVYPEKNNPPFVFIPYQNTNPVGLSVEYLELIAEKVGARLVYLPAKSRSQVLAEILEGKGDVIVRTDQAPGIEVPKLRYTESYSSVPVVLVVRRDSRQSNVSLTSLAGKRVAVTSASGAAQFIHENYPRIVLYQVTDDEVGLQQLLLGEVEALAIDNISLSYLLSRQTLSSVKITGTTGFSYELAFAVSADKAILQSILDKGLAQISTAERDFLANKWVRFSSDELQDTYAWFGGKQTLMIVAAIIVGALLITGALLLFRKQRYRMISFYARLHRRKEAKEKLEELAVASAALANELAEIKELEKEVVSMIEETKKEGDDISS